MIILKALSTSQLYCQVVEKNETFIKKFLQNIIFNIERMSKYNNVYPADYFDEDDVDDYDEYLPKRSEKPYLSRDLQNTNNNQIIKIIREFPTGVEAGLNKTNFNIELDENSQQWFNKIQQYFYKCK